MLLSRSDWTATKIENRSWNSITIIIAVLQIIQKSIGTNQLWFGVKNKNTISTEESQNRLHFEVLI